MKLPTPNKNAFLSHLITGLFLGSMLSGCVNNSAFSAYEVMPPGYGGSFVGHAGPKTKKYKVKRGDTLYSIALAHDLDFRKLAGANGIGSDYSIYAGQVLTLDIDSRTPEVAPVQTASGSHKSSSDKHASSSNGQKNDTYSSTSKTGKTGSVSWVWPVSGKIVRTFSSISSDSKGIDISTGFGEPVHAAADGIVVFAGEGIRGYGKLVIVQHSPELLSAYAFASRILVAEQETVKAGQTIAETGTSGSKKQGLLHFEVRKEGKPVNPMHYLPSLKK